MFLRWRGMHKYPHYKNTNNKEEARKFRGPRYLKTAFGICSVKVSWGTAQHSDVIMVYSTEYWRVYKNVYTVNIEWCGNILDRLRNMCLRSKSSIYIYIYCYKAWHIIGDRNMIYIDAFDWWNPTSMDHYLLTNLHVIYKKKKKKPFY